MNQVSIKYTNIFHCKTLQNLPKFGFLVSGNSAVNQYQHLAMQKTNWTHRLPAINYYRLLNTDPDSGRSKMITSLQNSCIPSAGIKIWLLE
jgi:hypothetical protein